MKLSWFDRPNRVAKSVVLGMFVSVFGDQVSPHVHHERTNFTYW